MWLDPSKTTPTQFYQFWVNVTDDRVQDFLKIYTLLDREEIEAIILKHEENPKERLAQLRLAHEVTGLVHGSEKRDLAEDVTSFITGRIPIGQAAGESLEQIRGEILSAKAGPGADMLDVLVGSGLAESKSEARRLLADNAISINNEKTNKEHLEESDFQNGRLLLRKGKAFKDTALVELG